MLTESERAKLIQAMNLIEEVDNSVSDRIPGNRDIISTEVIISNIWGDLDTLLSGNYA